MTQKKQIYKCLICGNITEVLHNGIGELVCCNQAMDLLTEKEEDEGMEKHVPVLEKTEAGVRINIGSVDHPMEENHYIEWIEINTIDNKSGKKFLKPEDRPTSEFYTKAEVKSVRAYCNVHGLWQKAI